MKTCLIIGDLNADLTLVGIKGVPQLGTEITVGEHSLDIGGSGGVVSAILAELGINTYMISIVGNDYLAEFLKNRLKDSGVKTDKITTEDMLSTGITVNLSNTRGKSQISSLMVLEKLNAANILFGNIKSIQHVHFSSYYMMTGLQNDYLKIIDDIRKRYGDVIISLDTNYDPKNKWGKEIFTIMENIDIFFANRAEALKITGESNVNSAIKKLSNYTQKVIIKSGKWGYTAKINGKIHRGRCKNLDNMNFKDSTGAGDNFDAGFIYGSLNNWPIEKTLEFANFCGEKSIEYIGGVGTRDKFKQIIKKYNLKK